MNSSSGASDEGGGALGGGGGAGGGCPAKAIAHRVTLKANQYRVAVN
jgi:hypothetical protein